MLRTNLATRPFYNVRVVHVVLGLAVAIVIGLTAFNGIQIMRLGASQSTLPSPSDHAIWSARSSALFSRRTSAGALFDG